MACIGLNKDSEQMFHLQISSILREQIKEGKYAPGARLGTVRQLAADFKVSTVTIGKALDILEKEKIINRLPGKGIFVAPAAQKKQFLAIYTNHNHPASQIPFILTGIEGGLRESEIKLRHCCIEMLFHRTAHEYKTLFKDLDGIFCLGGNWQGNEELLIAMNNLAIPVIHPISTLEQIHPLKNGAVLPLDEGASLNEGLKFLKSRQHTRIALVGNLIDGHSRGYDREELLPLLSSMELDFSEELLSFFPFDPEKALQEARRLLTLPEPPTALMCYSDYFAFGMIEALKKLNVRIPEDISVMGISGFPGGEFIDPPLTTISYEYFETGRRAAELMLTADRWFTPGQLLIETVKHKVIVRDSVKQNRSKQQ